MVDGMIETKDLVDLPLFAGADPTFLARIAASAADVRVNAGEYVAHEGESTGFFVLLSGKLEVTKRAGRSETVLVERETPGDYFGELPLLFSTNAFASLRAKTAARLARIEAIEFRMLLAKVPAFSDAMLATIADRIEGVRDAVSEAPLVTAMVVGRRFDSACHDVRDFLARNHVSYAYFDIDDPSTRTCVPEVDAAGDRCPIVKVMETGLLLVEPTLGELARAVGIRTEPGDACYDVAIVGGGPAGLAAAVYGASEGLRTVLLEREAPGGQAGTSSRIENYLGFPNGISGDELAKRAYAQATRFGADLVVTRTVRAIALGEDAHVLTLDDATQVRARSIVLATGVAWRKLDVEGLERFVGSGVFYGAARTEAASTQGRDIYLVGAGNSAGQAAMYFSDYAQSVTLVVRGDSLEKSMSDYLIRELHTKANVRFLLSSEIVRVYGESRLEAIEIRDRATASTRRCETNFVFVFIGADAETAWLPPQIARDARGYVVTGIRTATCDLVKPWPLERDPFHLETSVPGVFAAGDVRADSVKRCASAVGEGSMAIAFAHQHFAERANAPAAAVR
jgi:thioredoxin reductase (NADPH)